MHQPFEIIIPDVKSYNYEDGTQQPHINAMTKSLLDNHKTES
jgi:hypothetical protein